MILPGPGLWAQNGAFNSTTWNRIDAGSTPTSSNPRVVAPSTGSLSSWQASTSHGPIATQNASHSIRFSGRRHQHYRTFGYIPGDPNLESSSYESTANVTEDEICDSPACCCNGGGIQRLREPCSQNGCIYGSANGLPPSVRQGAANTGDGGINCPNFQVVESPYSASSNILSGESSEEDNTSFFPEFCDRRQSNACCRLRTPDFPHTSNKRTRSNVNWASKESSYPVNDRRRSCSMIPTKTSRIKYVQYSGANRHVEAESIKRRSSGSSMRRDPKTFSALLAFVNSALENQSVSLPDASEDDLTGSSRLLETLPQAEVISTLLQVFLSMQKDRRRFLEEVLKLREQIDQLKRKNDFDDTSDKTEVTFGTSPSEMEKRDKRQMSALVSVCSAISSIASPTREYGCDENNAHDIPERTQRASVEVSVSAGGRDEESFRRQSGKDAETKRSDEVVSSGDESISSRAVNRSQEGEVRAESVSTGTLAESLADGESRAQLMLEESSIEERPSSSHLKDAPPDLEWLENPSMGAPSSSSESLSCESHLDDSGTRGMVAPSTSREDNSTKKGEVTNPFDEVNSEFDNSSLHSSAVEMQTPTSQSCIKHSIREFCSGHNHPVHLTNTLKPDSSTVQPVETTQSSDLSTTHSISQITRSSHKQTKTIVLSNVVAKVKSEAAVDLRRRYNPWSASSEDDAGRQMRKKEREENERPQAAETPISDTLAPWEVGGGGVSSPSNYRQLTPNFGSASSDHSSSPRNPGSSSLPRDSFSKEKEGVRVTGAVNRSTPPVLRKRLNLFYQPSRVDALIAKTESAVERRKREKFLRTEIDRLRYQVQNLKGQVHKDVELLENKKIVNIN